MKNIFLYIIIIILIITIIYQNSTKKEEVLKTKISFQKIEECKEQKDKEIINESIATDKNQLTDKEAISQTKKSLKLSRVNSNGVSITWSIDTKDIDKNIKLIATLSKNNIKDKKVFIFKVDKFSNQNRVDETAKNLTADFIKVDNESLEEVKSNLNLPQLGIDGSKIIWKSSNPNVVSDRGVVIRPSFNRDEVEVTLTATIINRYGDETEKEFTIRVMPDESEIREVK